MLAIHPTAGACVYSRLPSRLRSSGRKPAESSWVPGSGGAGIYQPLCLSPSPSSRLGVIVSLPQTAVVGF